MKTPTVWRSKYTARGCEEPHTDEGCFAATATIQGIRMLLARCLDKRNQGHEAFVADYTQAFLNAEVREGEQLHVQPPEGWNLKSLTDGRRVVWRVCKAMLGLRTSPRRWQEHLSGKLKERGFVQDELDPCLPVSAEPDTCIAVHVDDMLAVGPNELTKSLLQELSKDMTMRWGMVIDKPQEFLGRPLCRTPQGYTFGSRVTMRQSCAKTLVLANSRDPTHSVSRNLTTVTLSWTNLDNDVTDSCWVGYFGWIVLTSRTRYVNCQLMSEQLPLVTKSTSSVC